MFLSNVIAMSLLMGNADYYYLEVLMVYYLPSIKPIIIR